MTDPLPTWDAIVVGGGAAGLSAATWLARYRRKVLMIDGGHHRNDAVEEVHGYLGLPNVAPSAILGPARAHLETYETASIRTCRVVAARKDGDDRFVLRIQGGEELTARRLVLATGVRDQLPDIAGFEDHYGASAFHCPTCDGYEARGRQVVVVGWGEQITGFALNLLDWAQSVTVVTDGRPFDGDQAQRAELAAHGVEVIEDTVDELVGERGDLWAARLGSGTAVAAQLVFFSIAHRPGSDLAEHLGCRHTDEGCVVVDQEQQTSVSGVYAAGDLTPGMQLVQIAAGEGTLAGVSCARSLKGERAVRGAPEPGPDPERVG